MTHLKAKGKVFVGLSGGVDSSTSAAILKKEGYSVVGVFIKVWHPDFLPCTWKEERLDAMRVAACLEIPFRELDLEKEYKKEVVDYMVKEYKEGRTPNPDVVCNKYVKFGGFFEYAMRRGADFIATGHYAQTKQGLDGKIETTRLVKGVDAGKDQSYFLWTITQRELSKTLFPIGGYEKPKVRKMAKKFGLLTAQKKDSQGLCFMGRLNMRNFLKEFIEEKKGAVLNEEGEVIGEHSGAFYYTTGQRHGFVVVEKNTNDTPYYISKKDIKKNTITVTQKKKLESVAGVKKVTIKNTNWISGLPKKDKKYKAQIRYRGNLHQCTVFVKNEQIAEILFTDIIIISKGQSLVLYDGSDCIGGGVID